MNRKSNPSMVYDISKVIAVVLVVVAHSTRMYTSYGAFSTANPSPLLALLTEYIYAFHMPLFIFISGAVYGLCIQRGKYDMMLPFVATKLKRLLIPYIAFGVFYVAPVMCALDVTSLSFFKYCYYGIIMSMDSRHLWFLLALFNIFVFAAVVRKLLLGSHKARLVVLLLSGIICVLAGYMPGKYQIGTACRYQLYFMVGACAHFYYEKMAVVAQKTRYFWVLLPAFLAVKFYYGISVFDLLIDDFVGIWMIVMAAVLLGSNEKLLASKWFHFLKNYSMGIFLFHPMIIYVCYSELGQRNIPPIVLSMGVALFSILLSVLLTKIVRTLRLGFLMGE